jgi:hypothetical protein
MIIYESTTSSFFKLNKQNCEEVERKLKTVNVDCTGFCNCYGYDLEAEITKHKLTYNIKLYKHQTTQNGIVIPVDAIDYAGVELIVTGIDNQFSMAVGKSTIKRFFCSTEIKESIPHPYFVWYNKLTEHKLIYELLNKLQNNKIDTIRLSNGKLICNIHVPTANPLKLIEDIHSTIKKWA